MTDHAALLQSIKLKVSEVNASMHAIELMRYASSAAERASYIAATRQAVFPVQWLRHLRTPKARPPFWLQLDMVSSLEEQLNQHPTSWKGLAAALNLFVLNTAIEIARLKAKGQIGKQLTELLPLNEQARELANRDCARPGNGG